MELEETAGWAHDCISTFSGDVTFANSYGYVCLRYLGLYKGMRLVLTWREFHFRVLRQLLHGAHGLFLEFVQLSKTPLGNC